MHDSSCWELSGPLERAILSPGARTRRCGYGHSGDDDEAISHACPPSTGTDAAPNKYASDRRTFRQLLSVPQLDVSVYGLEADSRPARLANVRPQVLEVHPAADRHLEIRVQRPIDGLQVHIRAELATELDDDVSGDRREAHRRVRVHLAESRADVAVDARRVDRSAGGAHVDLAVDSSGVD